MKQHAYQRHDISDGLWSLLEPFFAVGVTGVFGICYLSNWLMSPILNG